MAGPNTITDADPLSDRLTSSGYAALFGDNANQELIESLRLEPDVGRRLQRIINDPNSSWQARFLASEFLFRYVDMTLHAQCDRALLQASYFQALQYNYTGNGVDWGFAKGPNDVGVLGHTVVSLGQDDAFKAGLDVERPLTMNYPWSTPADFHPPYRVKDFAALLLAKSRGAAIDLAGAPVDRDRAIGQLKRALAT